MKKQNPNTELDLWWKFVQGEWTDVVGFGKGEKTLDSGLRERLSDPETILRLEKLNALGFPEWDVRGLCLVHSIRSMTRFHRERNWATPSELKRWVEFLRRASRELRIILKFTSLLPVHFENHHKIVPHDSPDLGSWHSLHEISRRISDEKKLREAAGHGETRGLLHEYADLIERNLAEITRPQRRSRDQIESDFVVAWAAEARRHVGKPLHEYGVWFFYVTFGRSVDRETYRKKLVRSKTGTIRLEGG